MKISAVGFLFKETIKKGKLKGDNYTYMVHKIRPDGNFSQKYIISSPVFQNSKIETVTPKTAAANILNALKKIRNADGNSKFTGAAIKEGAKETYIHSLISDKLFGIRTKGADGKTHYGIIGRDKARRMLEKKLLA